MKYFGTDGIRGVIDNGLDSMLAYRVGYAVGKSIIGKGYTKKVLIGNDTRLSNDLITKSIACGLMDMGIDCMMLGVVPTACVSYLTQNCDVGYGIMVTASHNAWDMNGIKIINSNGFKCDEINEKEIEENIDKVPYVLNKDKGRVYNYRKLVNSYIKYILKSINVDLSKLKIALDMANGSNYRIAPKIFRQLGANIVAVGDSCDGRKINEGCGAQHVESVRKVVLSNKCDYGFAFDGDADRLRVVLSDGTILDGDDILYVFAMHQKRKNIIGSNKVVGTIMTNSGLEQALIKNNIDFVRVDVGDKNVIDRLVKENQILGGEPSGHIVNLKYNTTCDALFNALYLLKIIINDKVNIKEYLKSLTKYCSLEENVKVGDVFRKLYREDVNIFHKVEKLVQNYADEARIIVRPSGTEAVFRIYIESMDKEKNNEIKEKLVCKIKELDKELQ